MNLEFENVPQKRMVSQAAAEDENQYRNDFYRAAPAAAAFENSESSSNHTNRNPIMAETAGSGRSFDYYGNHYLIQRPTQRRRRHHSMEHYWSSTSDHHTTAAGHSHGGGVPIQLEAIMGVKRDREVEGRCANCGMQTHQVVWASPPNLTNHPNHHLSTAPPPPSMLQKIPLTIENEVHRGRCLFCFPVRPQGVEWNHPPNHPNSSSSNHNSNTNMQAQQVLYTSQLRRNSLPCMRRRPSHVSTSSSTSAFPTSAASLSSFGEYSVDGDYMWGDNHNNNTIGNSSPLYGTGSDIFTTGVSVVTDHVVTHRSGDTNHHWHTNSTHHRPPILNHVESTNCTLEETLARLNDESADLCHVISTMRRFPTEARIQEMGCEKLWIQSWDDDNSMAIGRMGGIPTILDAMRTTNSIDPNNANSSSSSSSGSHGSNHVLRRKKHQHLHQCGCEALQNLAFVNDYNRDVIIEKGGVPVILDLMQRHWDVPDIQFSACTALTNLVSGSSDDSEDHKRAIIDAGGVAVISKVVHLFSQRANPSFFGEAAVRVAANQALETLGYHHNHRDDDDDDNNAVPDNLGHEEDGDAIHNMDQTNRIAVIPPDDDDDSD